MNEHHGLRGRLRVRLHDRQGRTSMDFEVHNLITDAGRNLVARLFSGQVNATGLRHVLVVGGGTTAAATSDTKLGDGLDEVEVPQAGVLVKDGTLTLTATLDERPQAHALTEAGVRLDVGGEQVLYNRVVFPVVNKAPSMQMTLMWTIDFGPGAR